MLRPRCDGIVGYWCATLTALFFVYVVGLAFAVYLIAPSILVAAIYGIAAFFKEFPDAAPPDAILQAMRWTFFFDFAFLLLLLLITKLKTNTGPRVVGLVAVALLTFHLADLASYHARQLAIWSHPLGGANHELTEYLPIRFPEFRTFKPDDQNRRWQLLQSMPLPSHVSYEMAKGYLLADWIGPEIKSHSWDKFVDRLFNAFPEKDFEKGRQLFPSSDAAASIFGVEGGVVQFFGQAATAAPNAAIETFQNTVDRCPNTLVVESETQASGPRVTDCPTKLPIGYDVLAFNANEFELRIHNNSGRNVWMYYANVWDEGWHALVNSSPATVYRANLAYQAIEIPPGDVIVQLKFVSLVGSFIVWLGPAFSIIALVVLIFALSQIFVFPAHECVRARKHL